MSWPTMYPLFPRTLLKLDALTEGEGALNCVHVDVGLTQRTVSADRISVRRHNSSTELRSGLPRTPRRSSERQDALMGAVGHSIVSRGSCPRGEDDASFKAPCSDEDDESSVANKAQPVGEATEAKCDV